MRNFPSFSFSGGISKHKISLSTIQHILEEKKRGKTVGKVNR